jgi:hypothetical protein
MAFLSDTQADSTKPLHRDQLQPAPKTWNQILKHQHSKDFQQAADKEMKDLMQKGTFEYIEKSKLDPTDTLLLLI